MLFIWFRHLLNKFFVIRSVKRRTFTYSDCKIAIYSYKFAVKHTVLCTPCAIFIKEIKLSFYRNQGKIKSNTIYYNASCKLHLLSHPQYFNVISFTVHN